MVQELRQRRVQVFPRVHKLIVDIAAGAAALVVITANTEPQDVQDWLFPPTLHAAAAREQAPKAVAEQPALVAAPVVDAVGAPVDPDAEATAPTAPEPFVPDVSTPVKVTTVIDAATL